MECSGICGSVLMQHWRFKHWTRLSNIQQTNSWVGIVIGRWSCLRFCGPGAFMGKRKSSTELSFHRLNPTKVSIFWWQNSILYLYVYLRRPGGADNGWEDPLISRLLLSWDSLTSKIMPRWHCLKKRYIQRSVEIENFCTLSAFLRSSISQYWAFCVCHWVSASCKITCRHFLPRRCLHGRYLLQCLSVCVPPPFLGLSLLHILLCKTDLQYSVCQARLVGCAKWHLTCFLPLSCILIVYILFPGETRRIHHVLVSKIRFGDAKIKTRIANTSLFWQMHRKNEHTRILSLRLIQRHPGDEEPKFGNRLMVHTQVRYGVGTASTDCIIRSNLLVIQTRT